METKDFLLEIGSEELPSAPLDAARAQLPKLVAKGLDDAGLSHGEISVISSPRRLAALVKDVASATEATKQVFRGPKAAQAFDGDGNPTQAALGFARSKGVDVGDLEVVEFKGEMHVSVTVETPAKAATEILGPMAEAVIAQLSWPRSMRWGSNSARYCRPVRWICCLLGDEVIPVRYANVTSGNTTWGHRVLAPGEHEVESPSAYLGVLEGAYVLDHDARAERIRAQIAELEESLGLSVDTPAGTFSEVVNLCEWPTVLAGRFDERFLAVPQEIICEAMLQHQRCFPAFERDGSLSRTFIMVSNGDPAQNEAITQGNERVVRARLDDAAFFFEEDLKVSMEDWLESLDSVTFQEKLGSLRQKVSRMEALAEEVARLAGEDEATCAQAARAAHLAKADLVSQAVVEFTSQQGVMGGHYARAAGESEAVALAVAEHYRPRFAGDALPQGVVGASVAVADKLDTICGMFAIDEPPTGSKDPFAQRRGAIGVIRLLQTMPSVSLRSLIDTSLGLYQDQGLDFDRSDVARKVADFFSGRLQTMARDEGAAPDAVAAIAKTGVVDPAEFLSRVRSLEAARAEQTELMEDLAQAFVRATHLADPSLGTTVESDDLEPAEQALLDATREAEHQVGAALASGAFPNALAALAALRGPIDRFFEDVLVMDEDPSVRERRLRLLNRFAAAFEGVADFSALAKAS